MSPSTTPEIIPGAEPFRLKEKGPKVLLIHGFTASPTEMRPIGDFLHSQGYDVYSVLLAGHGTTPEDLQTKTWLDWWDSVKVTYDAMPKCDYVIGFSMGALLAARLAVENQKKLKGLVLVSTYLNIKPKIINYFSFLFPLLKRIKPYMAKSAETEQFFKENNLISYMKYPMSAVDESIKLVKYTKKHILPKITIPTLIIQGAKDDRVDPNNYKILMKIIPSEEKFLEILPESQHIVTVGPDVDQLLNAILIFTENHF
ncbi:MAG: alpha/beta fold hydrolase [Asgard group archaeon]|nr:alpha/beta fold hydrolase [Asgard group archaeon]